MSFYPRIIYGTNSEYYIDFDKRFNTLLTPNQNITNENESDSGIIETLEFFDRDIITAGMKHVNPQLIEKLKHFYEYVKDGTTFSLILDRDLEAYYSFEGGSLVSNDGDKEFTFTRASTKYFINPETGLVDEAGSNVHSNPAGKYGRGINLEGAGGNYLVDQSDFSTANWPKLNVTVTTNNAEIDDPRGVGNNEADKLVFSGSGAYIVQNTGTAFTATAVFSIWLNFHHNDSGQGLRLEILRQDTGATVATTLIAPQSGWNRYSLTYTGGVLATAFRVQIRKPDAGNMEVMAWGASLYQNDWIQDYRVSGTAHDSMYNTEFDFDKFQTKGTVAFWVNLPFDQLTGPTGQYFFYFINDLTFYTASIEALINSSNQIELNVYEIGFSPNLLASTNSLLSAIVDDDWTHLAFTWDLVDDKIINIYFNGELENSTGLDYGGGITGLPIRFYLADHAVGLRRAMFDDLVIRTDALSATNIKWMYDKGRALGIQRNRWDNLILQNKEFNPLRQLGSERWDFQLSAKEELT